MSDDISQLKDRDLDAAVAEEVMGWIGTATDWFDVPSQGGRCKNRSKKEWHPSTDWSAAGEVLETIRSFNEWTMISWPHFCDEIKRKAGYRPQPNYDNTSRILLVTTPRNICEAAFKAVRQSKG